MRTLLREALISTMLLATTAPALAEGDVTEAAYESATWIFQCPTDRIAVPDPTPTSLVMEGAGPHYNLRGKLLGTPVTVKGKICPPDSQMRDIVLAIDVSGSMASNDPYDGSSCGRLEAVNAVLDSLPAGVANVGLVTFDSNVVVAATRLHADKASLMAEVATLGRGTVPDIICDMAGGTYYQYPLARAERLLQSGRKGATKELFLVSDGLPADTTEGEQAATRLKTVGITIDSQVHLVTLGTIMLGTVDDTYLKTKIASLDAAGTALHAAVADADDLADTLSRMSSATLAGAVVSHGPDSSPTRAPLDVMPYVQPDFSFEVPAFMLSIDGRQSYYDLVFEYWDSNRNRQTVSGRLHWID